MTSTLLYTMESIYNIILFILYLNEIVNSYNLLTANIVQKLKNRQAVQVFVSIITICYSLDIFTSHRIGVATKPKCEKVLQAVSWDLEQAASKLLDSL